MSNLFPTLLVLITVMSTANYKTVLLLFCCFWRITWMTTIFTLTCKLVPNSRSCFVFTFFCCNFRFDCVIPLLGVCWCYCRRYCCVSHTATQAAPLWLCQAPPQTQILFIIRRSACLTPQGCLENHLDFQGVPPAHSLVQSVPRSLYEKYTDPNGQIRERNVLNVP